MLRYSNYNSRSPSRSHRLMSSHDNRRYGPSLLCSIHVQNILLLVRFRFLQSSCGSHLGPYTWSTSQLICARAAIIAIPDLLFSCSAGLLVNRTFYPLPSGYIAIASWACLEISDFYLERAMFPVRAQCFTIAQ